jgi:hypothetical protein
MNAKYIFSIQSVYTENMDILQETNLTSKNGFLSHVFSTNEEGKAELLNVVQYAFMGVIPIVILNKLIQRFIPEADLEKSTLELLAEIFIQIVIMFCGIIVIHRVITYFPTYSGFKYENLTLTNVILAFLIIVLSIQTKLGIKTNILFDRFLELWNGTSNSEKKEKLKKNLKVSSAMSMHSPSQADYLDNSSMQTTVFPPAPVASMNPSQQNKSQFSMPTMGMMDSGPMPANTFGMNFGSF